MATSFFPSLWPNLVATICGVLIGLPPALWLNRLIARETERKQKRAADEDLARALTVIATSLKWNREKLAELVPAWKERQAIFDAGLETARWEAVRTNMEYLDDAELHGRLAYFFDRIDHALRVNSLHFDFTGGTQSALGHARGIRVRLSDYLVEAGHDLQLEAERLESAVDERRRELRIA